MIGMKKMTSTNKESIDLPIVMLYKFITFVWNGGLGGKWSDKSVVPWSRTGCGPFMCVCKSLGSYNYV